MVLTRAKEAASTQREPHKQLPAVFGRYVLLHCISRGGMGEIFLAKLGEIQGFEKPIVIKKILPHLAQDQEFLQRFIEEAQIAIKLTHGNIVPVYEVGMVDGEYFLALQYIEGRDLRALINRCRDRGRRLPPDLCLYLVREVANGLAYAHRRTDEAGAPLNLVHCDISPPNVLVTYEGEVKIIDFGIAKSAMQRAQANDEVGFGKFGYMAPEQLLRGATVDRRADLYSTGVILYELLTGQRVFSFPPGADYRQVAREVTAGNIALPSERDLKLTARFDRLVMKALRTEQGERYQSAEDLRDAIQQHLYAMNPTISADYLGAFMREVFLDEMATDRHMLRSLSQTDVEPFLSQISDASSHTVSYALAGGLLNPGSISGSGAGLAALEPPRQAAPALDPLAREHTGPRRPADREPRPRPRLATRRLSENEQAAALRADSGLRRQLPVSETFAVPPPRRWLYSAVVVATLIAVGGIAAAILRWSSKTDPRGQARRHPEAGGVAARRPDARPRPAPDLGAVDRAARDAGVGGDAADASDGGVHMVFPKETVHLTKKTKKGKKKAPEVSPAQVQAKFKQVRAEYLQFTRSYGHRLDHEWQQILFSNTYGNMDQTKYQRLNDMLDGLRRQMKAVREGG